MIVTNPKSSERHSAKLEVELINTIASVKNNFFIVINFNAPLRT